MRRCEGRVERSTREDRQSSVGSSLTWKAAKGPLGEVSAAVSSIVVTRFVGFSRLLIIVLANKTFFFFDRQIPSLFATSEPFGLERQHRYRTLAFQVAGIHSASRYFLHLLLALHQTSMTTDCLQYIPSFH